MRQVFVACKGVGCWNSDKHHVRGLAVDRSISGDLTRDEEFGLKIEHALRDRD